MAFQNTQIFYFKSLAADEMIFLQIKVNQLKVYNGFTRKMQESEKFNTDPRPHMRFSILYLIVEHRDGMQRQVLLQLS